MQQDSQPIVDVLITAFNHGAFIQECLNSVLTQKTDFDFRVLLGVEADDTETMHAVKAFGAEHDGRLKLVLNDSKNIHYVDGHRTGRGNFLNLLRLSSAPLIHRLEGDDFWVGTDKLQKMVEALHQHEEWCGVAHLVETINERSESLGFYPKIGTEIIEAKDTIGVRSAVHTSGLLFKRQALPEPLPSWFLQIAAGDMAIFSMLTKFGPIGVLPEVMSVYRKHEGGITNTSFIKDTFHHKRIELMQHLNEFHEFKCSDKAEEVIQHHKNQITATRKANFEQSKERNRQFIAPEFNSEQYDRFIVRSSVLRALKGAIPKFGKHHLDVGCGKMPYRELILLENQNIHMYTGLDIATARPYDEAVRPHYTWDGVTMPFKEGLFDSAMATEVLEHCPEPEITLRETLRVLKPGGILFFTVPFLWNLHEVPHDEYRYTPFSLERHLLNAGFTQIEINATGGWHASLAQMLALWVRRAPMREGTKKRMAWVLKPWIKRLLKKDAMTAVKFKEGQMITGLYGFAVKPHEKE
jgi:SAM-dependent methyltransferase